MTAVRHARPEDFASITLRGFQAAAGYGLGLCADNHLLVKHAWTAVRTPKPQILAIAGILPRWPGHGTAWAFISDDILGREWVAITRAVSDHLDDALAEEYHRVEAWCHASPPEWRDIAAGWLERLGFSCEGRARQFTPDGADMLIYSRVR